MINGLGIVGWGVGGIEAEAGMLGQPVYFLTPDVVGVHLTGALREGVTATDLALTVTQLLRKAKVVGKFVEFFGPGAAALPVVDRATIANMAPEYGATMGFFPIDAECVNYLRATGPQRGALPALRELLPGAGTVRAFRRRARLHYSVELELDLGDGGAQRGRAETSAGPDRIAESEAGILSAAFSKPVTENGFGKNGGGIEQELPCFVARTVSIPAAAARNRFHGAQPRRTTRIR